MSILLIDQIMHYIRCRLISRFINELLIQLVKSSGLRHQPISALLLGIVSPVRMVKDKVVHAGQVLFRLYPLFWI